MSQDPSPFIWCGACPCLAGNRLSGGRVSQSLICRRFPGGYGGGGFFATVYVLAIFRSAPRIGVVTLVAAVDFGQLAAALIMDATCAFGLVAREITPTRILLVVMVTGGLPVSGFSSERLAPKRFVRVCLRWPALTGLTAQVNLSDMRGSELLHFRSYPVRLAR